MFMKRLLEKTNKLQLLGNRIITNVNNKHNIYSTPTHIYEDYSRHQEQLIHNYIKVVESLHKDVERNRDKFDEFKLGPF